MSNANNPKPWENQDPGNKNLEALRNGFSLENIMQANVLTSFPSVNDMKDGQVRMAFVSGTKYLITKHNGVLYKFQGVPV